ncbi:hypothetical protein GCM10010112_59140 [Actinoplanes lobatus]|uniref:DUF3455 domain-containing protein n=1 Tax=Actinoplanes lobatus TaxID=113568 RepID=A0A7W7HQD1_9ACTN|nr:DUF3455 domain-containing protein [Actinoplanes lobatus]MBB4754735.1 hypothetical protein [Actinoplanes lobatus]GGN82044.1 hypothetical protein GCM10010112_59140 [Actinoplanes lobatus]GIE43133.1 hypothetical protein Alo02nite_60310 [Actinoplanes lobatus]
MAQIPPARPRPPADQQPPATERAPVDQQPLSDPQPPAALQTPATHQTLDGPQPAATHQTLDGSQPAAARQAPAGAGRSSGEQPPERGRSAGRRVKVAAAFGALALVAVAVPAGVSFAGTDRAPAESKPPTTQAENFHGVDPRVPAELTPPAGNVLHSVLKARGVQIYECRGGTWTLLEPAASLTGVTMHPVKKLSALHFRGPSWQSDQDGSLLEGDGPNAKRAPSEHPNSIPQLLIPAKLNRGDGVFGKVTYVQRLDTVGGVAPAGPCTGSGATAVPYRAVYRFFAAKP